MAVAIAADSSAVAQGAAVPEASRVAATSVAAVAMVDAEIAVVTVAETADANQPPDPDLLASFGVMTPSLFPSIF